MENSAEISPEVECRHCSSPSFWIECLKRFQRWQNQPFAPASTMPSADVSRFEDVVAALQKQMLDIQRNGQSLRPQVETANTKWSAWKDNCQKYSKDLLSEYQKSRFSVAKLQSDINKREKIEENERKYKANKAEKKRIWTALKKEDWNSRESTLKEKFLKDRERKWAEKTKRYDQQRVNEMKSIWDETQEACWKGEQMSWRQKWDEEMKEKWKDEKRRLKKEIADELLEWDFAKDFDDLKRGETRALTPLREQLGEIYQQTKATDLTGVLRSIEEMERGVERWSESMSLLSPSASNSLIALAAQMDQTMRLRGYEVARISDQRFEEKKEELEKEYDQKLQEMWNIKFQEMQRQFQIEIQGKGAEIEKRSFDHYNHLLTQALSVQQQTIQFKFDKELEIKNHEIDEYKTLIEELLENVAEVESKRSELQSQFENQTDHVFKLNTEICDLKKSHKILVAENDANWANKMELQKRKHERDMISLDVKKSDEYRTKDTYYSRLFDVYKKRLEDKKVQINRLLSDMRRESKRDENRVGEARKALEKALPRLMGTLRELGQVEEDKQRVNRKLEEETKKLSDRSEEEIRSLEEEVEKLREKHVAWEKLFLSQLNGCYGLEEGINKLSKSSTEMPINQRMVNMAGTVWQRDQLLLRLETSRNGNQQTGETDLENLIKSFNKLFE